MMNSLTAYNIRSSFSGAVTVLAFARMYAEIEFREAGDANISV